MFWTPDDAVSIVSAAAPFPIGIFPFYAGSLWIAL